MDEPRDGRSKKTTSKELLRPQAGPGMIVFLSLFNLIGDQANWGMR